MSGRVRGRGSDGPWGLGEYPGGCCGEHVIAWFFGALFQSMALALHVPQEHGCGVAWGGGEHEYGFHIQWGCDGIEGHSYARSSEHQHQHERGYGVERLWWH